METEKEKELWRLAKKRVGFKRHLATYIVINVFFWLIWYFTDHKEESAGVPWPIFPMLGWGIGLVFSFLGAYVFVNHNSVEKEYDKLRGK
ncbi:MAG: 2TM domain-containing protein [Bacteroidota bacterium]